MMVAELERTNNIRGKLDIEQWLEVRNKTIIKN